MLNIRRSGNNPSIPPVFIDTADSHDAGLAKIKAIYDRMGWDYCYAEVDADNPEAMDVFVAKSGTFMSAILTIQPI